MAATSSAFFVAWIDESSQTVQARRLSHRGEFLGEQVEVSDTPAVAVRIRTDERGIATVAFRAAEEGDLRVRRLDPLGLPTGEEVLVNPEGPKLHEYSGYELAVEPGGGFLVLWASTFLGELRYRDEIWGRFYDSSARPHEEPQRLDSPNDAPFRYAGSAVGLPEGTFVVTWEERVNEGLFSYGYTVHGKAFAGDGRPSGQSYRIDSSDDDGLAFRGDIAAAPDGRFLVAWTDWARQAQARLFDGTHLDAIRLLDGRFRVSVFPNDLGGNQLTARGRQLSDETGAFWFFSEENLEIFVKVLNGCEVNDNFWVFLSGLTDIGGRIEVEDTLTGQIASYSSSSGIRFSPTFDTTAFATCE
ncbi:MAG: hypothetical protein MPN21_14380 [Thermoanaerobaculia bacterium]|nr:hypothetical protein [Thermoanaerobaculia bacterium]